MNIVLATDNNFVQHCSVAMVSILKNNKDVNFYIFTEGLSSENENLLNTVVTTNGGKIEILIVNSKIVQQFPMPKGMGAHISIATYYRLFVTLLLPQNIDKVIYLDCDIVVRHSLEELWNENIDDYALGAVYQYNEWSDNNDTWGRLKIPKTCGYFNAGVLLMNLKYWREHEVQQRLFSFIREHFDAIRSHDQDILNAVLCKETKALSCNWNVMAFFFSFGLKTFSFPKNLTYISDFYSGISKDPTIVHYVSRPKPWEYACDHPFVKDYYKYLQYTPWKGWKPQFNWTNFKRYYMIEALIKIKYKLFP